MHKPVVVCGPTASGKTRLAVFLAHELDGEIVSADSMQIYRGMDIGTAKPTASEQKEAKHHMIDIADPGEPFSAVRYAAMASPITDDIIGRGKTPIICGGTGLYINALIAGETFAKGGENKKIREMLETEAAEYGNAQLMEKLEKVDPEAASRLHLRDTKRIIRALEVFCSTGKTITQFNEESKKAKPKYDAVFIGIRPSSRELLYKRINDRVDEMMNNGFLEEVKSLFYSGKLIGNASQAIGYKELTEYLRSEKSLDQAVSDIKQKTRNYAKRQLTWFNADKRVRFIEYDFLS